MVPCSGADEQHALPTSRVGTRLILTPDFEALLREAEEIMVRCELREVGSQELLDTVAAHKRTIASRSATDGGCARCRRRASVGREVQAKSLRRPFE